MTIPGTESLSEQSLPARSPEVGEKSPRSSRFLALLHALPESTPAWLARCFIGISMIAFGVQHFRYSEILGMRIVPEWLPGHLFWSWCTGAALLLAGIAILIGRYARLASLLLGFGFLLSALFRFVPAFAPVLHDVSARTGFFELLSCCGGAWMLAGLFPDSPFPSPARTFPVLTFPVLIRPFTIAGRLLFAAANLVFGLDHFQVVAYIAFLIPHWMPARLFLAWFTGFAFIAAALSIATRVWMRLAGLLLGLMYFLWVVLLHAPRIAHALHNGNEWNSGFVCLTMAGCAFAAASLATAALATHQGDRLPSRNA